MKTIAEIWEALAELHPEGVAVEGDVALLIGAIRGWEAEEMKVVMLQAQACGMLDVVRYDDVSLGNRR